MKLDRLKRNEVEVKLESRELDPRKVEATLVQQECILLGVFLPYFNYDGSNFRDIG